MAKSGRRRTTVDAQKKKANVRAKYGPAMKAAPVIIKNKENKS